MSTVSLNPYIFFRGDCRDAMEFYKSIFGGDLTIQTYADVKMGNENQQDRVMHALLEGGLIRLMASDTEQASAKAAKISLSLESSDDSVIRPVFDKLAEGGDILSELSKEFWGDTFGQLTDKYGIEWMFNIPSSDS